MLVDKQLFSNFYLHWFFSNLSFSERDPHMDSPEAIRVKPEFVSSSPAEDKNIKTSERELLPYRGPSVRYSTPGFLH